jgi:glucose/mannose-6-phosphate isomerase
VTDGAPVGAPAASPLPVDSDGMWEATAALPEQIARAAAQAESVDLAGARPPSGWSQVVVCGMGGSGIAGDVLAALSWSRLNVPVTVVKGYRPPAHVGPGALVFAVSCSGDTEETVAAAQHARERGATVVTVAGPGALARAAEDAGEPLVPVPATIPQPRAALGALAAPPLVVLERLGMLPGMRSLLDQAVTELQRSRDLLVQPGSVAQQLARQIGRTVPLVHGAPGPTGVAAMRWKTQVNENAKAPAFWALQPEICHNEVAGWGQHGDITRQVLTLVQLRYGGEEPRVSRRFRLVREVVSEVVANVLGVRTDASTDVAALFDLCLLGDFVSLHLAAAEGVDPGPVPVLGDLKRAMAAG